MKTTTITEKYNQVEKLIWFLVHRFQTSYGDRYGTKDELFSLGNETFMNVYQDHDPNKGPFIKRLQTLIWLNFLALIRTHNRHLERKNGKMVYLNPCTMDKMPYTSDGFRALKRDPRTSISNKGNTFDTYWDAARRSEGIPLPNHPCFYLFEFVEELSKDAREVIKLVLECPEDLRQTMLETTSNNRRSIRASLKDYLSGLGWTIGQIRDAFSEIKEALTN